MFLSHSLLRRSNCGSLRRFVPGYPPSGFSRGDKDPLGGWDAITQKRGFIHPMTRSHRMIGGWRL